MGRGGVARVDLIPTVAYSPKERSNRQHWTITIGIIVIGLTWAWRFISFVNVALYCVLLAFSGRLLATLVVAS